MNEIKEIQKWYHSQCDGEWEHSWGLKIATLDNPGWSLEIDLIGTSLEQTPFEPVEYHIGKDSCPDDDDWYVCKLENKVFKAFAGPCHLRAILQVFLHWQKKNT
ncbi:hypothetical protein GX586_03110 [bacterium]|nr:hypothetical protein [bacterium]